MEAIGVKIRFERLPADEADVFYIGRFSFRHDSKLLISDWRSPVASMFYDHEVGPAWYIAPAGRIDGELTRKRQIKIALHRIAFLMYQFKDKLTLLWTGKASCLIGAFLPS